MPRRSIDPEQQPGEPDWIELNRVCVLADFGNLLSQKSHTNKWSQHVLAPCRCPSNGSQPCRARCIIRHETLYCTCSDASV